MIDEIGELGKTEWAIIRICWKKGKSSVKDIYEESLKEKKRSYMNVKNTMDRLVKKGYLKREKFGPIWLYSSKITEKTVKSKAIDNFIKNALDNSIAPIFMQLIKKEKYRNELNELRQLVNELEKNDKSWRKYKNEINEIERMIDKIDKIDKKDKS